MNQGIAHIALVVNDYDAASEFEYGTIVVFEDLYRNLWNLTQPNEHNKGLIKAQKKGA